MLKQGTYYFYRLFILLLFFTHISFAILAQDQRIVRVTLLQLNDVYQTAAVDKGERGGLARVATLRKKIMDQSPHTLFLLGGDTLAPSVASIAFKGKQMIDVWNHIGLDYAALGNHEFDFGDSVLLERMKESRFTWLAANVIDKKTRKPFGGTPPFVIREFDGIKIGLFGLLTPETARSSKPGPDVEFLDPIETAKRVVSEIRKEGAKVIVALTHLTMSQDKELARSVSLDVIVGGHEHALLQSLSGRTPIFKVGSDARTLGRIDLNIYSQSGELHSIDWELIPVTRNITEDSSTVAIVEGYEKKVSVELDKPIGRTSVILDAQQKTNRSSETNLGNFITDAYRNATKADVAIINSGSIRSNTIYSPGELTKRDALSILPFESTIVKIEALGSTLRAALEHGVSRIAEDKEEGRFPQVSGLRFTFDSSRPSGSRVTSVTVGDEPLDDKKIYTLATNSYLVGGGDGYSMFKSPRYLLPPEEAQTESAILINAISSAQEISPKIEGRIKQTHEPQKQ
jgi:5'-nucleotidase